MPTLALLWDAPHFVAAAAPNDAALADASRLDAIDLHEPDGLRPDEWVEWIAPQLGQRFGTDGDAVAVVLPRDRVTWRSLAVPPVPESELPPMVANLLAMELSGSAEGLAIDYLPPVADAAGKRHAAAAAIPRELLGRLRALADRLGRPLAWVGPSTVALHPLLPEPGESPTTYLAAGPRAIESITVDGARIVEATGRRHGQTDVAKALAVEHRRRELHGSAAVVELTDRLDAASLIGAARAAGASELNLADPHVPPPPSGDGRRLAIIGAAAASLLIAAGLWSYRSRLADLDDEIERVETAASAAEQFVKKRGDLREIAATITAEEQSLIPAPVVLSRLAAAVPPDAPVLLGELTMRSKQRGGGALLTGAGYAIDRDAFEQFETRAAAAGLIVRGQAPTASDDRDGYPVEFELEMELPPAASDAAATDDPAEAP